MISNFNPNYCSYMHDLSTQASKTVDSIPGSESLSDRSILCNDSLGIQITKPVDLIAVDS